jgi:hypothetical protein
MSRFITSKNRLPLWLKVACCAFVAFHLFINLRFYGPLNYLWFCDIAMLTGTLALCIEGRLLLSITVVAVMGPSVVWSVDFLTFLLVGRYPIHMAEYMTDGTIPAVVRATSLFHIWLPIVLVRMMWRLGYDRRALAIQTVIAIALLVTCRTFTAPPPAKNVHDVVNINSVYGNSDTEPQTRFPRRLAALSQHLPIERLHVTTDTEFPAWLYICYMVVKFWVFMYLPTHLFAVLIFDRRSKRAEVSVVEPNTAAALPR